MEASRASGGIAATLATNIREARLDARLTQRQVADAVGVETMAVSRWERGAQRPRDAHVALIARATNRAPGWFYAEHDAEPAPAA